MSGHADLIGLVETLRNAEVLCVGDIILDHFHYGSVERISPEAPVPVLRVEREDAMLGGAGNVARNLLALGAGLNFVSVIGEDHAGEEIRKLFGDLGITNPELIVDDERPTAVKIRFVAGSQQVLRADKEVIAPLRSEIRAQVLEAAGKALKRCQVLVLSDYGKGVLDDGVATELIARAQEMGCAVVVDPKGADFSLYRGASVITPNRRELGDAAGMPTNSENGIVAACRRLIADCGAGAVLATRGRDGMTLVTAGGEVFHLVTEARDVFDVSGAGDTVAATLAAALAAGAKLSKAAALANVAAGIVVAKVGTAAAYADDVIGALRHQDLSIAKAKIMGSRPALDRVQSWRQVGQKIGFTNGCFDLLHPGHVSLLTKAKEACDRLVVGLNDDASVTRLKGADRPIQTDAARAAVLASLASVDMVVIFAEDTPMEIIEALRPDLMVKGADYAPDKVVGADYVESYGGRVMLVELEPGYSTSATISRMAK